MRALVLTVAASLAIALAPEARAARFPVVTLSMTGRGIIVGGTGFASGERVGITVLSNGRTRSASARTDRRGRFRRELRGRFCGFVRITARGERGDHNYLLAEIECTVP